MAPALAAALLSACAGYGGSHLKPGLSTLPEVVASMGEPALRWDDPDGRVQLAYPRGPLGTETFMAYIAPDGRLERIEAVLDAAHFARIEAGRSDAAAVLRVLGPPHARLSGDFGLSGEPVWKWRFCDGSQQALFGVVLDVRTDLVRMTYRVPDHRFPGGEVPSCGQTRRP